MPAPCGVSCAPATAGLDQSRHHDVPQTIKALHFQKVPCEVQRRSRNRFKLLHALAAIISRNTLDQIVEASVAAHLMVSHLPPLLVLAPSIVWLRQLVESACDMIGGCINNSWMFQRLLDPKPVIGACLTFHQLRKPRRLRGVIRKRPWPIAVTRSLQTGNTLPNFHPLLRLRQMSWKIRMVQLMQMMRMVGECVKMDCLALTHGIRGRSSFECDQPLQSRRRQPPQKYL